MLADFFAHDIISLYIAKTVCSRLQFELGDIIWIIKNNLSNFLKGLASI